MVVYSRYSGSGDFNGGCRSFRCAIDRSNYTEYHLTFLCGIESGSLRLTYLMFRWWRMNSRGSLCAQRWSPLLRSFGKSPRECSLPALWYRNCLSGKLHFDVVVQIRGYRIGIGLLKSFYNGVFVARLRHDSDAWCDAYQKDGDALSHAFHFFCLFCRVGWWICLQ